MSKYYALAGSDNREADVYIFGDIVTPGWERESEVSGHSFAKELSGLDADVIRVHINSYGGVVSEGLAIMNTLMAHKAKIITYCDGFACSSASVVFMAGNERYMYPTSLLMIHNAWMNTAGNANELRRDADTLEKMSKTTARAYLDKVNIGEEQLSAMLDDEAWITPEDALKMGFATGILQSPVTERACANIRNKVIQRVMGATPGTTATETLPITPKPVPDNAPKGKKLFSFRTDNAQPGN